MNLIKAIFLISLSICMLAIAGISSFYAWNYYQEVNLERNRLAEEKIKNAEFRRLRNEYFVDAFKLILHDYNLYGCPGLNYNEPKLNHAQKRLNKLFSQMKSEGYNDMSIEMLLTRAGKQYLKIQ